MTAMTAEREASNMSVEHLMILFPPEATDFHFDVEMRVETQGTKLIRSPCVSSAFATIMRRTCIVLVRIVLEKINPEKDKTGNLHRNTVRAHGTEVSSLIVELMKKKRMQSKQSKHTEANKRKQPAHPTH